MMHPPGRQPRGGRRRCSAAGRGSFPGCRVSWRLRVSPDRPPAAHSPNIARRRAPASGRTSVPDGPYSRSRYGCLRGRAPGSSMATARPGLVHPPVAAGARRRAFCIRSFSMTPSTVLFCGLPAFGHLYPDDPARARGQSGRPSGRLRDRRAVRRTAARDRVRDRASRNLGPGWRHRPVRWPAGAAQARWPAR